MSVLISRENLTRQEEEFIVATLVIKPEIKTRAKPFYQAEEEPFPFFVLEAGNKIRLPYAFACVLLSSSKIPRPITNHEREYPSIRVTFTGSLRPRQLKKVTRLDQHFQDYMTATFCGHTGFGKTRIANYYISKFGLRTLVMVPGTQLLDQWPKAIAEILPDAKVASVGYDPINPEQPPDVLVCMPGRVQEILDEIKEEIGFLIVDEAHMFCTATRCPSLLEFEPKYVLALTASPRRRDGTWGVIQSLCGLHHVKARYQTPVMVWSLMTGLKFQTIKDVRGNSSWVNTLKKIVEDETRNKLITDLVVYLVQTLGRKPIVMSERKYHITDLTQRLKAKKISCDYLMENKNNYQNSQVLLAITKKAGTGFDEQYACPDYDGIRIDTVVYTSSFRELNGLIQYGGRAFRAQDPLIIHLVDRNNIVENHWREAKRYYRSGEYLKTVTVKKVTPEEIGVQLEE